jgi:hypothetical protein
VTQIILFSETITVTDIPDTLKSYDLVWLMHMVGDAHQPLHASDRFSQDLPQGDAGGNFVLILSSACGTPQQSRDLHALWDNPFGIASDPRSIMSMASSLSGPTAAADDQNVYAVDGSAKGVAGWPSIGKPSQLEAQVGDCWKFS